MSDQRVIVLGLDGATFEVLGPLVEEGELPHLARLMEEGAWGRLESTIPPFSVQAWVSMATGKNPAKHGVIDFWNVSADRLQREFASSRLIQGRTLWGILSQRGKKVGVVNVPVSYPPQEVNGYLLSGFLTPRDKTDYTYPPDLRAEILQAVGDYAADPYDPLSPSLHLLKEFIYWMGKREEANRYLLRKYPVEFFMNVVQALDHLQHLFWKYLDVRHPRYDPKEAKKYRPLILECYRLADTIVGQRLEMLEEGDTLFIISDHGFGPAHKRFHVNRFLANLGLLTFQEGTGSPFGSLLRQAGITPQRAREVMRRADILGLRRHLMGRMARIGLSKRMKGVLTLPVDWSRTKAYSGSPATEGIYVNLKGHEPQGIVELGSEYEEVRGQIKTALLQLRDPESGEAVVKRVYRREEIYSGPCLAQMPDIVFCTDDSPYLASDNLSPGPILEEIPGDQMSGKHRPEGVFIAFGDYIQRGLIEGARIIDVAPTILYAMGLPIPNDMDGRVLLEAFHSSYRESQPIRYEKVAAAEEGEEAPVYSEEEMDALEERLKGLGYL